MFQETCEEVYYTYFPSELLLNIYDRRNISSQRVLPSSLGCLCGFTGLAVLGGDGASARCIHNAVALSFFESVREGFSRVNVWQKTRDGKNS